MIILDIEAYCQNCPNFSVEHNKSIMQSLGDPVYALHTLTCKRKDTCKALLAYLKEEQKK